MGGAARTTSQWRGAFQPRVFYIPSYHQWHPRAGAGCARAEWTFYPWWLIVNAITTYSKCFIMSNFDYERSKGGLSAGCFYRVSGLALFFYFVSDSSAVRFGKEKLANFGQNLSKICFMKWNWRPLSLKSCHLEASKDISRPPSNQISLAIFCLSESNLRKQSKSGDPVP